MFQRMFRMFLVRALSLLAAFAFSTSAWAQNCPEASPTDSVPDSVAIQACLDRSTDVYLVSGWPGYLINDKIRFRSWNRLLTSVGEKARLVAHPDLDGPIIEVQDANYYEISLLTIDGNHSARTKKSTCFNSPFAGAHGSNMFVSGVGYVVHHVDTVNAMCGSGMEVTGNGFDLYSIYSAYNGDEAPAGPWSDGITLGRCDGGHLHDSWIEENSDVGLMFFRGTGCLVDNNSIKQLYRSAFSAFTIGSDQDNSDFTGTVVTGNTVQVGYDRATTGIDIGPHIGNASVSVNNIGSVRQNTISGAVVNLLIDGISSGEVVNNTMFGAQGSRGISCSPADYTAGHFGSASLSGGWIPRTYDGGVCTGSGPSQEVTFFEDINFSGASFGAIGDVSFVGWPWNDRISSLRIPAGKTVVLYEHSDYGGAYLVLTGDEVDLRNFSGPGADGTWNDAVSSVRIY